jgi:hypothetical protein
VEQDIVDDFSLCFGNDRGYGIGSPLLAENTHAHRKTEIDERKRGREGRRESGRAGGRARERESQRQKDVGWVVQH